MVTGIWNLTQQNVPSDREKAVLTEHLFLIELFYIIFRARRSLRVYLNREWSFAVRTAFRAHNNAVLKYVTAFNSMYPI